MDPKLRTIQKLVDQQSSEVIANMIMQKREIRQFESEAFALSTAARKIDLFVERQQRRLSDLKL